MHITFVHNVYNFLYVSQRCMFQNILLRGIHNQKSWEISGGDRDRKEQPGTLKKKKNPFKNGGEGMRMEKVNKRSEVTRPREL